MAVGVTNGTSLPPYAQPHRPPPSPQHTTLFPPLPPPLTIAGLLELVPDALQLLHGLHVGRADPLQDALLLVEALLQLVHLPLDLVFRQGVLRGEGTHTRTQEMTRMARVLGTSTPDGLSEQPEGG